MINEVLGLFNYWIVIFLMMLGFYIVIARSNFIKKIIGMNIFQISVILLYVTFGKISGGTSPIVKPEIAEHFAQHHSEQVAEAEVLQKFVDPTVYSHPLPSVLMLTAIVVGIGTTAVALTLVIRIWEEYGTLEEDEVLEKDRLSP